MICLVHGYGLTGSGSNQWTRSIAQGMVENGESIHLICQENRPEQFAFITEAYRYEVDHEPELLFKRDTGRPGRCVLHRPEIALLPTFVRPKASSTSMACILDMDDAQIQDYLQRNEAAVRLILARNPISSVHVNHVVLMAVVVHRICGELGIPFGVLPHGSAIEYVVKHDPEMRAYAEAALEDADRIFILSEEMRERIKSTFGGLTDPSSRMAMASAGVDTTQFRVVSRPDRRSSILSLKNRLAETPRGKSPAAQNASFSRLRDDVDFDGLLDVLQSSGDYPPKFPDADLEAKLDMIDWEHDRIITYVGKIIGYKGVASIITAFPAIAARDPRARLLIAGRGNLREGLEALVWALGHGKRNLVESIITWGGALEGEAALPFDRAARYMELLASTGHLDAYYEAARTYAHPDRIVFTGYMEHHLLSFLLPCCDVAVFPSIVKEAAPLVVPEAMASGCFPMGTDFAGMGASLDAASEAVPDDMGRLMRLRPEPQHTVIDIVDHASKALDVSDDHRHALRELAVRKYDWRSVAGSFAEEMRAMSRSSPNSRDIDQGPPSETR